MTNNELQQLIFKQIFPISQEYDVYSTMYPAWGNRHKGKDYACPTGTPLYAVFDGEIIFASTNNGWGNLVELKNGNFVAYYAHQLRFNVTAGQQVKKGDLIGWTNNTGTSTGPHLHFGIMEGIVWINPCEYKLNYIPMDELKNYVKKDIRLNFNPKNGSVWICNNNKRYKIGTKPDDIVVLAAMMCGEHISDAELKNPITTDRREVL